MPPYMVITVYVLKYIVSESNVTTHQATEKSQLYLK